MAFGLSKDKSKATVATAPAKSAATQGACILVPAGFIVGAVGWVWTGLGWKV